MATATPPAAKRRVLRRLGFASYDAYLRSNHWARIKRDWRLSGRPRRCETCGDPEYQLHHLTYDRLGAEMLTDLQALCERCHSLHHQLEREGHNDVEFSATRAAEYARRRPDLQAEPPGGQPQPWDKFSLRAQEAKKVP